jgi:hypothetical protein
VVGDRNTEFLGGSHRLAAVDQKLGVSKQQHFSVQRANAQHLFALC